MIWLGPNTGNNDVMTASNRYSCICVCAAGFWPIWGIYVNTVRYQICNKIQICNFFPQDNFNLMQKPTYVQEAVSILK